MRQKPTPPLRSEEHTRALLAVFDLQTLPDLQAQILTQARARQQASTPDASCGAPGAHPVGTEDMTLEADSLVG